MFTYIIRRILITIPLLLGLLTVNFFLIHAAPGDPTDIFYNPDMDPEARENLRRIYGLDQPLGVQYVKYIQGVLLDFEFGYSIAKKRPVRDEILDALPNLADAEEVQQAALRAIGVDDVAKVLEQLKNQESTPGSATNRVIRDLRLIIKKRSYGKIPNGNGL